MTAVELLKQSNYNPSKIEVDKIGDNTLLITLHKGQKLKEHKTPKPAVLLCVEGEVIYSYTNHEVNLKPIQYIKIEADLLHELTAVVDSKVLLIKS